MPHFHHKRRHSWPYCGSGMRLRERRNLPIITVTAPSDGFDSESQFMTPVQSGDLLEDDAASAGIIRSQPAHSHRLWHHPKDGAKQNQTTVAAVSLRKMMQPPLDRARSLFVLPTTMSGETVLLPYWVHRLSAHPITTNEKGRPQDGERGRLMIEKNHRRCHSERPRSWKQPSEKLWPLAEE
ncbi:hypothetical protein ASPVEDRAFT_52622 [Aspergillus versicolor CBS 583.65]|uniref:Uncharacterized protein n=1 Tax=Aspergillus versicolor CBS 583.65 TaxID=1036611 RepID=A0A1L9PJR3_ASPVE|nr:uncharacterized protein ASPVEDRAFT_52622 [Aspergillus versicolor CBS 583.65]OJJ01731.1 hypothetical protein ASPVEDRAFT_52622 [Aspergillus versicolor CBS 583.65]